MSTTLGICVRPGCTLGQPQAVDNSNSNTTNNYNLQQQPIKEHNLNMNEVGGGTRL